MSSKALSISSDPKLILPLTFLAGAASFLALSFAKKQLKKKSDMREKFEDWQVSIFRRQIDEGELVISKFYQEFRDSLDDDHFIKVGLSVTGNVFNSYGVYLAKGSEKRLQAAQLFTHGEKYKLLKMYCIVDFNQNGEARQGHVDDGVIATVIDHLFGTFSSIVNDYKSHATAYLKVDKKRPLYTNKEYMIVVTPEKIDGKKVFLKAIVFNEMLDICVESSSLLLTVNWSSEFWNQHLNKADRLKEQGE